MATPTINSRFELVTLERLQEIYDIIISGGTGVTQIVAGANIVISPVGGTGVVTISSTGSSGTTSNVLIDGGTFLAPTENTLIDAGTFI